MASDPTSGRPDGPEEPAALDPAEMLRMLREQQHAARDATEPDGRLLFAVWGVAWLVGYLAMWFSARDTGQVAGWAGWTLSGCIIGAVAFTIMHSVARTSGTRGPSARFGAMYGWSWFLAFTALGVLLGAMARAGASYEVLAIASNGFACMIVGLLYIACALLFEEVYLYFLGAWMLVTAVVAAFAGMPNTYLVMSFAGGGGFLAMALIEHVIRTRRRSTVSTHGTEGGGRRA